MIRTCGKLIVIGTVRRAKPRKTFFIVPAIGFPSMPSCALHWEADTFKLKLASLLNVEDVKTVIKLAKTVPQQLSRMSILL